MSAWLALVLLAAPLRVVVGVEAGDLWRADETARVASLVADLDGVEVRRLRRAVVVDASVASVAEARGRLRGRRDVRFVEQEVFFPVRPRAAPDDPLYPEQWTLHAVTDPAVALGVHLGAEAAWAISTGRDPTGAPVRIAVVDDGFDLTHPDLRFVAGYDFSSNDGAAGWDDDPTWEPGDFHGTETAGVAAALGDNATGISGVCPDCDILPARLIGGGGPADLYTSGSAVAAAIEWAAFDGGAAVINNSWGPPDGNPFLPDHALQLWPRAADDRPGGVLPLVLQEALRVAVTDGRDGRGALITWSAGNGNELVTYDGFANNPWVLAIGSVDSTGQRAYYSDFGPPLFLVAPSSGDHDTPKVLTTDIAGVAGESADDTFAGFGGTSASSAMVAGVAALVIAAFPDLWAAQVAEAMALSAYPIDDACDEYASGRSPRYGFGRVDAGAALAQAALYADDCTFGLELCANGRDDDCDGTVDDPAECERCVPDDTGGETCDGRDNDCDLSVDEDFVCVATNRPTCAPCRTSTECALGSRCRASPEYPGTFCFPECDGTGAASCPDGFACNGEICLLVPSAACGRRSCREYVACGAPERCDGKDNDCDGVVDDLDPDGEDARAARLACDGPGVCAGRGALCLGAFWVCAQPPNFAFDERCGDRLDNDCDGEVDEGCLPLLPPAACAGAPGSASASASATAALAALMALAAVGRGRWYRRTPGAAGARPWRQRPG